MASVYCIGHAVEDHVFGVDVMPSEARKHQASSFEVVGGGAAANAAVAIARLGGDATLAARVGADSVGSSIVAALEKEGVDCARVKAFEDAASSVSAVFVDETGERLIMNYKDGNMPSDPAWAVDAFPENAKAVLADVRWPEGAIAVLTEARRRGLPAILDADHPIPSDGAILKAASHLAFSADGLRFYSGEQDIERALMMIARQFDAWCCVTDGANGVFISARDEIFHAPAIPVKTVDTLGAGDIWHGAFALALAEAQDEKRAVTFANIAAAIKVTRSGGRNGAPTRSEIDDFEHQPTNKRETVK